MEEGKNKTGRHGERVKWRVEVASHRVEEKKHKLSLGRPKLSSKAIHLAQTPEHSR